MRTDARLAVLEAHPVQYHAPVYRYAAERLGVPVVAVYGSDLGVAGYYDPEFGQRLSWDTDLLTGYGSIFLRRVDEGKQILPAEIGARGLRARLKQLRPSALLILGYGGRFNRGAINVALSTGLPLLFRAETTDHAKRRGLLFSLGRDLLLRYLYSRLDQLLYVGSRSREHFVRLGVPAERLTFSPYCVDDATFAASERDRSALRDHQRRMIGAADRDYVILFAGKLIAQKDPLIVFTALARLPKELRDRMILAFLGEGVLRGAIEAAAARNEVRCHLLGFANQRSLSPHYHAADLFVLPSLSETWGLVVNEALLHGVPVVASNGVGAEIDLIRPAKTGEVFVAGSASALTDALHRAIPLLGRADVREECRGAVREFSVENAARGIRLAFERARGGQ